MKQSFFAASPLLRRMLASPDEPAPMKVRVRDAMANADTLKNLKEGKDLHNVRANLGRIMKVMLQLEKEDRLVIPNDTKVKATEGFELLCKGMQLRPRHHKALAEMVGYYHDVSNELSHREMRVTHDKVST